MTFKAILFSSSKATHPEKRRFEFHHLLIYTNCMTHESYCYNAIISQYE